MELSTCNWCSPSAKEIQNLHEKSNVAIARFLSNWKDPLGNADNAHPNPVSIEVSEVATEMPCSRLLVELFTRSLMERAPARKRN